MTVIIVIISYFILLICTYTCNLNSLDCDCIVTDAYTADPINTIDEWNKN